MFVHFDTESLQILSISPVKREDGTVRAFEVEVELGRKLVSGEEKLQEFVVYKEGEEFILDRVEQLVIAFNQQVKALALTEIEPTKEEAECNIIYDRNKQELTIQFSRLMNTDIRNFAGTALTDEKFPIYITKKNDPTYLLQIIDLVVLDLVQIYNGRYTVKTRELPLEVSFYTRQFFKSYSLEYIG